MADSRLADLRAILFDLDGVVYRGNTALPGARELFPFLDSRGITYMVLTNNSTLTPGQYQAKLRGLGIRMPLHAILTSSQATARYLAQKVPAGTRMLPIGEKGLRSALTGAGFVLSEQDPAYVVAGLDRHLTYARLAAACRAVSRGAVFLGTNPDPALPVEGGLAPGTGSIQAAITACTGVRPETIGKPAPTMLLLALERLGVPTQHAAMVGDSHDTDIAAGRAAGLRTVLVLTGISSAADVAATDASPDFVLPGLPALIEALGGAPVTPGAAL